MKFKVDEMPTFTDDCPFYNRQKDICRLDGCHCRYFDKPTGDGENEDCDWLTDES